MLPDLHQTAGPARPRAAAGFSRRQLLGGATLLAALAAARGTPARAMAAPSPIRVAFVNPGRSSDRFWQMVTDTMRAAAADLSIDLSVTTAERDRQRIMDEGRAAVAQRPDFLVIVNEHRTALPVLEEAEAAGVPTLLLLNAFRDAELEQVGAPREKLSSYLGALIPDNRAAGYRMGQALIAACRKAGLVEPGRPVPLLAINGLMATPAASDRMGGLQRAIAEDGAATLLDTVQVNWSREEARERTLGLLRRWPGTAAIWCANDDMALGCAEAAETLDRRPGQDLLLAGLNWSPEGLSAVVDGRLHLSMGGHFLAGAWAMVLLRDYADGRDFARGGSAEVGFDFQELDQAGARRWLAQFGAGRWSDIDFNRFRQGQRGYDFSPTRLLVG